MIFLDATTLDPNAIIVNVVLALVGIVITAVGGFLSAFIKSKLNSNQLELLDNIAANVVLAVEQSSYGKELSNDASAKKALAENMMATYLHKYGIDITAKQLDATIEAAVGNVLNSAKLVEPPKMIEISSPDNPSGDITGFIP